MTRAPRDPEAPPAPHPWPTLEQARAWLREGRGRGVKVAVLDSGVEAGHPALGGLELADDLAIVEQNLALTAVAGEGRDVFGHGTAVAGLVRALAPEARIGSFRVLGEQLRSRTHLIGEGVRQALARGYHILNCSFACAREDQVLLYKAWVDEAYLRGCHLVAACNNQDFTRREWPAHFPTAIAVNFTACDRPEDLFWRPGHLVEFAARGQEVEVAWSGGGKKRVTGSSYAAPHVAGLLARLLSGAPGLSPLLAKALLQRLAQPSAKGPGQ